MSGMTLPREIARLIGDKPYRAEEIGRSGSTVWMLEDAVLKVEKSSPASEREYKILKWLDGKLRAPRVLARVEEDGFQYLFMTRLSGRMACDRSFSHAEAVKGLAKGLKTLWTVDISDCPASFEIGERLSLARERMESGVLDGLRPSDECRAVSGCADFPSLWAYLDVNRPTQELVFSHGDYCLPNVFLCETEGVGFLDLGSAGVADRWYDIMMCLWSLRYNFCELGGMDEDAFASCKALFFRELDLEEDREKLRYHSFLDEFFQV